MRIGLVGEAPHDTNCIGVLLNQLYPDIEFFPLINQIRGSQLDCPQPTKRLLRVEFKFEKPDLVIFIRDLDGLAHETDKIDQKKAYYAEYRTVVDNRAILLLNIYEIEALILADMEKFGVMYNCEVPAVADPSAIKEPKEYLKQLSRKYSESHNLQVFQSLNIEAVAANCNYFSRFLKDFKTRVI
ncbi:DUF4276 family protein [Mucilaginibacter terrae]|uniref:DUF4276 family protein n=1 Tax=Mucilaginibacter terrae TaxID=1955052 RepID=UPI00363BC66D